MSVEPSSLPTESKLNGLITYFSILFQPKTAFERLRAVPMWGWAAIAGIVLTMVTIWLSAPAQLHFASVMQQQRISQMPADQQAQAKAAIAQMGPVMKVFLAIGGLIGPWFGWLVAAVVFLIAAALTGGEAKFRSAWVASVNSYVVYGISGVVNSVILSMRDPSTVNSMADVVGVPSLGLLVHNNPKLYGFLAAYTVLNIWYYVVVVIALEQVLKIPRRSAIIATVLYSLVWALLAMSQAK